jgi:hypothetical protein
MRGFPHSNEPEKAMMGELLVGVTLSGWSPMMRIPMKEIQRAVKPRAEGSIPNNIKPNETRTPAYRSAGRILLGDQLRWRIIS